MEMDPFANDTWRFRPGRCSVWVFVSFLLLAPSRLRQRLLLLLPFLLLFLLLLGRLTFAGSTLRR